MLPHHNQRVGQHIQAHGQPPAGHAHHEFVLFERIVLIVKH
jgi:hypothetical protein